MVTHLTKEDRERITAAIGAAEQASMGEIVPIVATRSDAYHDVGLHYAVLAMLASPAGLAFVPDGWIECLRRWLRGWDGDFTRGSGLLAFEHLGEVFEVILILDNRLRIKLSH